MDTPQPPSPTPSPTPSPAPPRSPLDVAALPAERRAPTHNTMGIVAFACSVLGFCLPVIVSVPALIIAVIAVLRAPRGFAIAAIVFSLLQIAGVVAGFVLLVNAVTPSIRTVADAEMALFQAESLERDTGEASFPIGGASKLSGTDAWGTVFRTEVIERDGVRTIYVWSAGPDAVFDSSDDFVAASRPQGAALRDGKPMPPFE